ncbi:MAG: hypothetical protein LH481_04320, partial [Burkholderiales bacterium]|nr:hypothetical protein [Burkholderiales bacterium]
PSEASNSVTPVGSVPVLNSVIPSAVEADSTAKTLSLTGLNFFPPVFIVVGTETFSTTSSTLTTAQFTLPARLFNAVGQHSLTVKSTVGVSNSRIIEITPPAPRLVSSTPATLNANSQMQTLTLTGVNFVAPLKVRFDGTFVATTFISATQLSVSIPGTLLTSVKTATVTAETTVGTSNILTINVVVYVPNELPIVQIYEPYGNEYPAGESIIFSANAYDPDGYIEKIEIVENGTVLATQLGPNFYLEQASSTGQHNVIVRATDDRGGIGEVSVSFYAVPSVDEPILAAWNGMNDALIQGNTNKALTFLTTGAQEKYRSVFEALIGDMPSIIASYSKPSRGQLSEDMAEYAIMRDIASEGDTQVFFVYFSKDSNGKWLVDSM